ncbi:MAG: CAP domain-containing protein [Planctomycetota bacterium]|nr:CAP domain-containing protein [Planctomycetota bacterium]
MRLQASSPNAYVARAAVLPLIATLACACCRAQATELEASEEEKAICDLTNAERQKAGLEPLRLNAKLFEAARGHSAHMAKHDELTHELDGKNVSKRADEKGYKWSAVGENVAWNQRTPEDVVRSWMKSSGHRANILNKDFDEIGVGIAPNKKGELYYTQVFGRPAEEATTSTRGAGGRTAFTVANETRRTVKLTLPVFKETLELEPGETGTYTLGASREWPLGKARVGKKTLEFKIEDGASYVIQSGDGGFEIVKEEPVRTR